MKTGFWKRAAALFLVLCLAVGLAGCSGWGGNAKRDNGKVVIYTNADDEAVDCIKKTLDDNGYAGQYILQTFGTSELGSKMLTEGRDIEADLITMESYYITGSESQSSMFRKLSFKPDVLPGHGPFGDYMAPFLANQGALLINTKRLKEHHLPRPKSIRDLVKPVYKGELSMIDIESSSTAWMMLQALVNAYGEKKATQILSKIYENAGENLEQSGSGPLKKIRAGEVSVGFGLRHQAIADKKSGLPVDYVDPTEGNFTLTESLAVVEHESPTTDKAMKMLETIIKKGRPALMKYYPVPLYHGETAAADAVAKNSKIYPQPLTTDLLQKYLYLSRDAKELMGD